MIGRLDRHKPFLVSCKKKNASLKNITHKEVEIIVESCYNILNNPKVRLLPSEHKRLSENQKLITEISKSRKFEIARKLIQKLPIETLSCIAKISLVICKKK